MVNQRLLGVSLLVWSLFFAGCTKKSSPDSEPKAASTEASAVVKSEGAPSAQPTTDPATEATPSVEAYKVFSKVPAPGHVEGAISFKGTPPINKAVVMNQAFRTARPDDFTYCDSKNVKADKVHVLGSALANVLVEIHGVPAGKAFGAPVALRAKNCRLSPQTALLPMGSIFTLANDDPFEFSAVLKDQQGKKHWAGALKSDIKERSAAFDKTGDYFLTSDSHPWMSALVRVMEHPYYAVTDPAGVFRIEDIPSGNYEVVVRHQVLGTRRVPVAVTEGATAKVELAFGE